MSSRVADRVARELKAAGIELAFGMPGGEVVTALDALGAVGIRFVLARNETAAAMMAAGASAVTGRPGLLLTTLGPGLANAVNGIADAAQERVPLVVLSGVVERSLRARYTHQIVDHAALLRPLVKASFEIEANGASATVRRAVTLATTPPFGPVHLDLSPATAAMADPGPDGHDSPAVVLPVGIDKRSAAVLTLRDRLARAERPLILAGYDAARGGASEVLAGIADRHAIPVVTTYKGKGVLDEDHPAALGAAGLSPAADRILLPLLQQADLVLLAGYDPIEMRAGWLDPFAAEAMVVEVGPLPADHGMHQARLRLVGPVRDLLEAAFDALPVRPVWGGGEPAAARRRLHAQFSGAEAWGPGAVVDTLQQVLPREATVTVDSGAHRILLSQQVRLARPLGLLQSAGWCTMGSALPLAIGATLADPGRRVVAVLGDGGLEMTLGELGTLRDQGLSVIVLVLQDESLALIEMKQQDAGLPRAGVALGATQFDLVAQAFGGHGCSVASRTELDAALRQALAADRFTVIACRIGPDDYAGRF